MEKILIIIPVYKVEDYIETCLESVIHQSYQNLEILIVDDGSPDRCPDICDRYATQDDRIQVIHQSNQGLSAARNTGIEYTTGEYVLFLDSDDYLSPNYCEIVLNAAERTGSDIVVGEIVTVDGEGGMLDSSLGLRILTEEILDKMAAIKEVVVEHRMRGYAWGKLYKKHIVDGIRYPVGKAFEDRFTIYKYFEKADKVCLCPEAVIYYRLRLNSIMHSTSLNKWYDVLEADQELLDFCKNNYPSLVGAMESSCFGRYVHVWIKFYDSGYAEEIAKLVQKMKTIYKEYKKKYQIKFVHKLSYILIFLVPHLYRWLIHIINFDKNERDI